jgi:hypothetical protein
METSKKTVVVASLCVAIAGVATLWSKSEVSLPLLLGQASPSGAHALDEEQESTASAENNVSDSTASVLPKNLRDSKDDAPSRLWPEVRPLDPEERERFDAAAEKVARAGDWGHLDKEDLQELRQTLWQLSDRGAAEYGRDLAALSAESVRKGETATKAVMNQVQVLDLLVKAKRPQALQVVADLATRPLPPADTKGTPRVQRFVTLQLFDTYASSDAPGARDFVNSLPEADKAPYVFHYYIGRQLAGVEYSARLDDVSESFGAEYIAKLKLDKT